MVILFLEIKTKIKIISHIGVLMTRSVPDAPVVEAKIEIEIDVIVGVHEVEARAVKIRIRNVVIVVVAVNDILETRTENPLVCVIISLGIDTLALVL